MSYKKKYTPLTVVMKSKISYRDQNHFLYQDVNTFFFCCNMGVYGIDFLLQPVSSGQTMNCSLSQLRVAFKREN